MRRPWIKVETSTPDKPEICAVATSLRMDADAVLGKLIRLWSWVEVNRAPANDLGVTKEFIDKLVGRKGFAAAMITAGWLIEGEGKLGLKNLDRHNGGLAKVRALTAHRVAVHRKRKLARQAEAVSKSLDSESLKADSEPQEAPESLAVDDVKISGFMDSSESESDNFPPPVTNVTPSESHPMIEEVQHPTPPATNASEFEGESLVEDNAPRKRRSRSSVESPDQPLLF